MPAYDDINRYQQLELNLSLTGTNIESATIRVLDSPTHQTYIGGRDSDDARDGLETWNDVTIGSYKKASRSCNGRGPLVILGGGAED